MRVTRPNLLSWFDSSADANAIPTPTSDCRQGALITYPGEITSFYFNPRVGNSVYQGIPLVELVEYRSGGSALTATSNMQADVSGQTVNGTVTCPAVAPGLYRWRLTWGGVVRTSNLIEVLTEADARACSVRIEYRNTTTKQGIRWPWIDAGFLQKLRIRASLVQYQYPEEVSQYREVTTGYTRNYNTYQDKVMSFRTGYADAVLLEGLAVALTHDTLLINSLPVTRKEGLTYTPGRSNLSVGTFAVIDNSFAEALLP